MSETVIIIGAGRSKHAGAPLMNDFLDVADQIRRAFPRSNPDKDFELVFKGRDALQSVHSKATMDLLNLESVFAAFEMARLLHSLGDLSIEEIEALPGAMSRVIQRTLEDTVKFSFKDKRLNPPSPYAELVAILDAERHKLPAIWDRISFIT